MSAKSLTVAVPDDLLKRIRGRARRAKRTVEAEVIQLLTEAISAENTATANGSVRSELQKKPWTSLADWAEKHGEHWGSEITSEDVESLTGRRF